MNGWFRDKATYQCYDDSYSVTIYKLDGEYDRAPHSPARRQEVLDDMVSTAMVSLVHLYRNSVGGLIDSEARRLLSDEFEALEDKRWKWMFARSDEVAGDTAGAVAFSETAAMPRGTAADGASASLTAAKPGLSGSSRYLLFEQVPVDNEETSRKVIPSYRQNKSKYACHIYAYSDLRDYNAGGAAPAMESNRSIGLPFANTTFNVSLGGDNADLATDPMHRIDFGVTGTKATDGILLQKMGATRKCMYRLAAGTPLNGLPERSGTEGFEDRKTRIAAIQAVSAPIPGDGPFNPKRSRQLGSAGVYDGLGRPSSAWFARARFKAFMASVNKKRRVDAAEPEYDLRDINGYIADTLNRREEIAVMYPRAERIRDACEIVNLAATCIVGEATTDWYVETDPLNGMSFDNRLRLVLPPHKLTEAEKTNPELAAHAYYCHSYVNDGDDFAHLFPKRNPPANPGHNAVARHAHLARLATAGIRRSKRPGPNLVPQRPFERRVYTRPKDAGTLGLIKLSEVLRDKSVVPNVVLPEKKEYVGCGFSEAVVEPLCRGAVEAADGLVDAVTDFTTMFKDTESEFAEDASKVFHASAFEDKPYEFVLLPTDPDSLPCGEIDVDDAAFWMVGATPTALSCAAKLAMTYVATNLTKRVPQTVEEEDLMHAQDAIAKLATNARYTADYDDATHSVDAAVDKVDQGLGQEDAGMGAPLVQAATSAGMADVVAAMAARVQNLDPKLVGVVTAGAAGAAMAAIYANVLHPSLQENAPSITASSPPTPAEQLMRYDKSWFPKTQNEYYSKLYAAIFWVVLGKNADPDTKEEFRKLMVCSDPEYLQQFGSGTPGTVTSGSLPVPPGVLTQSMSLDSTQTSSSVYTGATYVATAIGCLVAMGTLGLGVTAAVSAYSGSAAVTGSGGAVAMAYNSFSLSKTRAVLFALAFPPPGDSDASKLSLDGVNPETIDRELLNTTRKIIELEHAKNHNLASNKDAEEKNRDGLKIDSQLTVQKEKLKRLQAYYQRMLERQESGTEEPSVDDNHFKDAQTIVNNGGSTFQVGKKLAMSVLMDDRFKAQRNSVMAYFSAVVSNSIGL